MSTALNIVTKWRNVFALMWTANHEAKHKAIKNASEQAILHRCELSALAALLIQKGVFTHVEFTAQAEIEAEALNEAYEKRFPGMKASLTGVTFSNPEASRTMQRWSEP